jgi:hypothetical protein
MSLISAIFVVMYLLNVILHKKLKENVVCRWPALLILGTESFNDEWSKL